MNEKPQPEFTYHNYRLDPSCFKDCHLEDEKKSCPEPSPKQLRKDARRLLKQAAKIEKQAKADAKAKKAALKARRERQERCEYQEAVAHAALLDVAENGHYADARVEAARALLGLAK